VKLQYAIRRLGVLMKKILIAASLIAASASAANAADLAARPYAKATAPMIAALYDWSGFYIGANGGWGSSHDSRTNVTRTTFLGRYDATGGVAGGQLGYRWQTGAWVFGLEAQGDWADLRGSTQSLGTPLNSLGSRMDAFGLFTGQVGYAWNNALLYVKGGAAVTDRRYDFVRSATGVLVSSSGYTTRWGGTAGVGLEFGFAPNWSAAIEYDHILENTHTVAFTSPAGLPRPATFRSGGDTELVTVRLNYRFGLGPVIATY
jgi:outer membrane immunogenic protein